jgi:glycosyltransferase involved in cell wall biosynthesis
LDEGLDVELMMIGARGPRLEEIRHMAAELGERVQRLEHEKTGLLLEPDDAIRLAGAMQRLLIDEDLSGRVASAWHEQAMELAWARTARRYLEIAADHSRLAGSR